MLRPVNYTKSIALYRYKNKLISLLKNIQDGRYKIKYFNNANCSYCNKRPNQFNKSKLKYFIIQYNTKHILNFCCNLHYYKFIIESTFIKCNLQLRKFNKKISKVLYKQYIPSTYEDDDSFKITNVKDAYNYLYNKKTKSILKKTNKPVIKKVSIIDYIRNFYIGGTGGI